MAKVIATALSGLVLGGILAVAQWVSPPLLPWAVGFMLACLAANLRTAIG